MGAESDLGTPPPGRTRLANCCAAAEQWGRPGDRSPTPASSAAPVARPAPAHLGPPRPRFRARTAGAAFLPSAAARPGPARRSPRRRRAPASRPWAGPPSSDCDTEALPSATPVFAAAAFPLFPGYIFSISPLFSEVVEMSHFHLNFNLLFPSGKDPPRKPKNLEGTTANPIKPLTRNTFLLKKFFNAFMSSTQAKEFAPFYFLL